MFSSQRKKQTEKAAAQQVLELAHSRSSYSDRPLDWFDAQVRELAASNSGGIDFDELFYLEANEDVRASVDAGAFPCGYIHYCLHGQDEFRLSSTHHVRRTLGVAPHMPKGLTEPVLHRPPPRYAPNLTGLPEGGERLLVILVSYLDDRLYFAGYAGFFADMAGIADQFDRVTVVVTHDGFDPRLVERVSARLNVISLKDIGTIAQRPSLIYCFDTETFYQARDIFGDLGRTVYYCQDFEAGFFPFGSSYARSEGAVARSRNIVFSTVLLKQFMERKGLLSADRVYVTAPKIVPVAVSPERRKRVFFYFRPERFNSRNMPELVMEAVGAFCRKHAGYEVFLVGTVETTYSFSINGTPVSVISKLPRDDYAALLGSCDAVVALIYSAHPGVIAFQAAASGLPTVTNVFENRDAECLRAISENIVPFDPVREDLLTKVEEALARPKGVRSFNERLYAGTSPSTFTQFNLALMEARTACN